MSSSRMNDGSRFTLTSVFLWREPSFWFARDPTPPYGFLSLEGSILCHFVESCAGNHVVVCYVGVLLLFDPIVFVISII